MVNDGDEFQRSLGRIEGLTQTILKRLDMVDRNFSDHKNDDQKNFSSLRLAISDSRKEVEEHLSSQDLKLGVMTVANERLKTQDENTRAVGKYILGLIASLVVTVGAGVIAALTHHLTFK